MGKVTWACGASPLVLRASKANLFITSSSPSATAEEDCRGRTSCFRGPNSSKVRGKSDRKSCLRRRLERTGQADWTGSAEMGDVTVAGW